LIKPGSLNVDLVYFLIYIYNSLTMRIICLLLLCNSFVAKAQHSCDFDLQMELLVLEDVAILEQQKEVERKIKANLNTVNLRTEIEIPVVIHVVWNAIEENLSDELIWSQVEALNRDFNKENNSLKNIPEEFKHLAADVGIKFCLATENPRGETTNGIVRIRTNEETIGIGKNIFYTAQGGSDAWDTERYLNIWICNMGTTISGYGTYPTLTLPAETGVVINFKYFGINGHSKYGQGRTTVHEVGHFLGLKHIWGTDSGCETDDGIEDTPFQQKSNIGCPQHPQKSCGSNDLLVNFMDYVQDPCMVMFTKGQKEWMRSTLFTFRSGLVENKFCETKSVAEENYDFKVFPNPASAVINIEFKVAPKNIVNCQIFATNGQLLLRKTLYVNRQISLDITRLPVGVYYCKIGAEVRKILKK